MGGVLIYTRGGVFEGYFGIMIMLNKSFSLAQYAECLQTNNSNGLPFFQGYTGAAGRPKRRIHHQHQAIIPMQLQVQLLWEYP